MIFSWWKQLFVGNKSKTSYIGKYIVVTQAGDTCLGYVLNECSSEYSARRGRYNEKEYFVITLYDVFWVHETNLSTDTQDYLHQKTDLLIPNAAYIYYGNLPENYTQPLYGDYKYGWKYVGPKYWE